MKTLAFVRKFPPKRFHKIHWLYISRKIWQKYWRFFFAQTTANFCKNFIVTLVFEMNANFFPQKNGKKIS
jgi:hypothetical protein